MLKNNKKWPCTILDPIAITLLIPTRTIHFYKKSSFQAMFVYRDFFLTVSRFSQVHIIFTNIFIQSRLLCHFLQYPNLHNSCVNCFIDSFNCKLTLLLYRRSTALNLAYEKSKTYALMAREIPWYIYTAFRWLMHGC